MPSYPVNLVSGEIRPERKIEMRDGVEGGLMEHPYSKSYPYLRLVMEGPAELGGYAGEDHHFPWPTAMKQE